MQGTNIAGATSSIYTRPLAQLSDSGTYQVAVSNLAGAATSALATITVATTFSPTILSPAIVGTNFAFSFQSLPGKTYGVEYKDDLQDANWLTLQSIAGDGSLKTVITPVTSIPRRFYRLSVQ